MLLQAIANVSSKKTAAPIRQIISFIDYVNHSIITFTEFIISANYLIERGYIRELKTGFKTTTKFQTWYEKILASRKTLYPHAEFKLIQEFLETSKPTVMTGKKCSVKEDTFAIVVCNYLKNF